LQQHRQLELFFPFDPYLLRRSAAPLALGSTYVRWRRGHPAGAVRADLDSGDSSDSDSDSELMSDGEEEEEAGAAAAVVSMGGDRQVFRVWLGGPMLLTIFLLSAHIDCCATHTTLEHRIARFTVQGGELSGLESSSSDEEEEDSSSSDTSGSSGYDSSSESGGWVSKRKWCAIPDEAWCGCAASRPAYTPAYRCPL